MDVVGSKMGILVLQFRIIIWQPPNEKSDRKAQRHLHCTSLIVFKMVCIKKKIFRINGLKVVR